MFSGLVTRENSEKIRKINTSFTTYYTNQQILMIKNQFPHPTFQLILLLPIRRQNNDDCDTENSSTGLATATRAGVKMGLAVYLAKLAHQSLLSATD